MMGKQIIKISLALIAGLLIFGILAFGPWFITTFPLIANWFVFAMMLTMISTLCYMIIDQLL